MTTRIVSAIVGVAIFLGCCFAGIVPFVFAVVVIASIAAAEFTRGQIIAPEPVGVPSWVLGPARLFKTLNVLLTSLGLALVPLAYSIARLGRPKLEEEYSGLVCIGIACGLIMVARAWSTAHPLGWFRLFYGKVGFWYVGAPFSCFVLLRAIPGRITVGGFPQADRGAWIMLFVACCVWATDSFAYFVGRAIGKKKLAPKLSPGKTVEGFLGGVMGAAIVGVLFGHAVGLSWLDGGAIGIIAGVIGPLGDLFESGLKRELGIKDFGSLMPGHGGALDRFDSLLFVAPLAYLYLKLVAGL